MKNIGVLTATIAVLVSTGAQAAIVNFTTAINVPTTFDGVYINFRTGATGTSAAAVPGWDFNPFTSGTDLQFFWNNLAGGVEASIFGPYKDLAPGAVVSVELPFTARTASAATINFRSAGDHILGFKFLNEATGGINYGYLNMTNGGSTGFPATITGWSYENTGAPITVVNAGAAIPEPATWAMMIGGFGLIGAAARRRQRSISYV